MTPYQEQMGTEFLSLSIKIPAFWLGGRKKSGKRLNKKNAKGHSNTVDIVTHLAERIPVVSPLGKEFFPYPSPSGCPRTLFIKILLN
jgi:hypothetical protein